MNLKQKFLAGAVAASAMASAALAPVAHAEAEVSASVGAANMYYWRGYDLGNGDPAVWGDINVSASGFYAGMWASSGDAALGTEYDLYAGYGNEINGFSFDLSLWSYSYPSADEPISPGDNVEAILGVGYGPLAVTYYHGLEDLDDYSYLTVGAAFGDFSLTYGVHDGEAELDGYSHVDLSYAYNENLSFTLGLVTDDVDGLNNDEAKFVVGFSIPIE
ncbi:TorF family putative porin [Marinimicrobium sp. ARAG 43.8]|uniref:TorF family putative porin n=1 Tax=Marinimicrobium sp. ARAG 43.8 TaxID=3418719 RepID=UPI003CF5C0CE